MTLLDLLIGALATWWLAYTLVETDGLFGVFKWLRGATADWSPLHCVVCTSIWAAALVYALSQTVLVPVVYVLALAGGALFVHSYGGWRYKA